MSHDPPNDHQGARRWGPRVATALLTAAVGLVATAGPALAAEDGAEPGSPISATTALMYFVLLPLVLALVIGFVVAIVSGSRRGAAAPAEGPRQGLWWGAPPEAASAVAVAGSDTGADSVGTLVSRTDVGGARARW